MAIDKCVGKPMRIAVGDREKLFSMNKILEKVELYIDTEGNVYMVPVKEEEENLIGHEVADIDNY